MSDWITDRLPNESDTDIDCDVLVPPSNPGERAITWRNAAIIQLGDPWMPAPPPYVPSPSREDLVQDLCDAIDQHGSPAPQLFIEPPTRDELVQDLIASIDKHGACGAIQEAREKLK